MFVYAEENNVVLAAHPNDPPMRKMRGTERILIQPNEFQKLLNINESPNNKIELCLGTFQEMSESGLETYLSKFAEDDKIGYIHFRNVKGKVPNYIEAFVDEGTMVDSHALVGSCAQVGKRVHLSAAVQIGGVLEPIGALPVIVEDEVLVGGNCGVYEGSILRRGAVLGSGVILTPWAVALSKE